jgi:hypothetical protein
VDDGVDGELESLAKELIAAAEPRRVVAAAGRFMAYYLRSDGFGWVSSRSSLEKKDGGRVEQIEFETSRWNKRGTLIAVQVARLRVLDDQLKAWRTANQAVTVRRPESVSGIVCAASFLDFVGSRSRIVLTTPGQRVPALEGGIEMLREIAFPWLSSTRDAGELPDRVPDRLLGPADFAQDLVELLMSRGNSDAAKRLIRRVLDRGPEYVSAFEEGQALARDGGRPQWHSPVALGWSSEVLGLANSA